MFEEIDYEDWLWTINQLKPQGHLLWRIPENASVDPGAVFSGPIEKTSFVHGTDGGLIIILGWVAKRIGTKDDMHWVFCKEAPVIHLVNNGSDFQSGESLDSGYCIRYNRGMNTIYMDDQGNLRLSEVKNLDVVRVNDRGLCEKTRKILRNIVIAPRAFESLFEAQIPGV